MSIDVYTLTFCFIVYCDCYILFIVECCPIKPTVAEEFLFLSARRRAYMITTFHSLLIIILLSLPP